MEDYASYGNLKAHDLPYWAKAKYIREESKTSPNKLVFSDDDNGVYLFHANCLEMMDRIIEKHPDGLFDMIFADPPYFLSNGGITCQNGRMVKVDKGDWDKSQGPEINPELQERLACHRSPAKPFFYFQRTKQWVIWRDLMALINAYPRPLGAK